MEKNSKVKASEEVILPYLNDATASRDDAHGLIVSLYTQIGSLLD